MPVSDLVSELESTRKFFCTTISIFEPQDAGFAPHAEMYTTAAHVSHVADTVDWFMGGAFGAGWDLDFDGAIARAKAVTSLEQAQAAMLDAFERAIATVQASSNEALFEPIPNDTIMHGAPRQAVISGIVDHTAHHRGSLAVYARLLGKVSPMPYA